MAWIRGAASASLAFFLTAVATSSVSHAVEIKFLCASALGIAMDELPPQFERSSGHKVVVSYANVGVLKKRIQKGEAADVSVVSKAQIAALIKSGKVAEKTDVIVANVGIGVFVRKGAPRPDISSPDAFKRSLLKGKAIAFNDPTTGGPVGIYIASLLKRLGIAEQMKSRIILIPRARGLGPAKALSKGDAEIGFSLMIDTPPMVELVGPLPEPIQHYIVFSAGIIAASGKPEASRALITFIISPKAQAVLRAKGFDAG
jgi:molybdate transport system substrate-binding protein